MSETKVCTKCGQCKLATAEFFHKRNSSKDGLRSDCKVCFAAKGKAYAAANKEFVAEYHKSYYAANKEDIISRSRAHYANNKEKASASQKKWRESNKEAKSERDKAYAALNKEKIASNKKARYEANPEKAKAYRVDNKEAIAVAMKRWRSSNKEVVAKYQRAYIKANRSQLMKSRVSRNRVRISSDPIYAMSMRARSLIRIHLRKGGYSKKSRAHEILGCDWDFFKSHIERQFTKGMGWDRLSEIHLDHIVPMASAKTEADVIALNHFTNLRPMWAADNLAKSDTITHLI